MDSIRSAPTPAYEQPALETPQVGNLQLAAGRQTDAIVAGLLAVVHAIAWSPVIVGFMAISTSFKKVFADFGMKLPWLTEFMIDVSDLMSDLYPLAFPLFLVLVGLDGWLLYILRRKSRPLSWVWFVVLMLVAEFSLFVVGAALCAPLLELMTGLSR